MPCQDFSDLHLSDSINYPVGGPYKEHLLSSKCDGCKQRFENQLQKRASTLLVVSIAHSNKNHFLWKETGRMVLMESNKKERDENWGSFGLCFNGVN